MYGPLSGYDYKAHHPLPPSLDVRCECPPLCRRYRRRGFEMRGVGPASDGDAVGGTAYWAAGLHLYSPLPLRPHWGGLGDLFRTHAFLTAGNIGDFAAPGQCRSHAHAYRIRLRPPVAVH